MHLLAPLQYSLLLSSTVAHPAPGCDSRLKDLRYPAAHELVDTIWAHHFLEARANAAGNATAIQLTFNADGSFKHADAQVPLSPAARAGLTDSVRSHLVLPQPKVGKDWSIFLAIGWWEGGAIEILPLTVTCEPSLINRAEVQKALEQARDKAVKGSGNEDRKARFLVGILADGTVRYASLQTSSGVTGLDSTLAGVIKQMRFTPATMGDTRVRILRAQSISLRAF